MARPKHLKNLALLAAISLTQGSSFMFAQDGFIRQPSMSRPEKGATQEITPAATAPATETATGERLPQAAAAEQQAVPRSPNNTGNIVHQPSQRIAAAKADEHTSQSNPHATLPATSNSWPTPPQQNAVADFPTPPAFRVPALAPDAKRELQWLKRGEAMPQLPPPQVSMRQQVVTNALNPEPTTEARIPAIEIVFPSSHATQEPEQASSAPTAMPTVARTSNSILNALAEQTTAAPTDQEKKQQLARLISARIGATKTYQPMTTVKPLSAPPGWESVRTRLQSHLQLCEQLLRRNAIYSARQEAQQGMLYLTQILDEVRNEYVSTPAWARAQQALQEAEDFKNVRQLTSDANLMQRLVESHQTPVLKTAIVDRLPPLTAAQHYREYAKQQMLEASKGHSWASEVFYSLGRTHQAEADNLQGEALDKADSARWKAVVFYRAAVEARASNALAANQLGFLLLQMDQPHTAQRYLELSLQHETSPDALRNLIEACRRLGDLTKGQEALVQLQALERSQGNVPVQNQIIVVDQQDFAAWSPHAASPTNSR